MHVPTNKELYDNAPDTVEEAVYHWLLNHLPATTGDAAWFRWAAKNLRHDPEILGAMKKEFGFEQ